MPLCLTFLGAIPLGGVQSGIQQSLRFGAEAESKPRSRKVHGPSDLYTPQMERPANLGGYNMG